MVIYNWIDKIDRPLHRVYFSGNRLLNNKIVQTPRLGKLLSRTQYFNKNVLKKKIKKSIKKKIFKKRKQRLLKKRRKFLFKIPSTKQYVNDYWLKNKTVCETQSLISYKRRYRHYEIAKIKAKHKMVKIPKISHQLHIKLKNAYERKKAFTIKPALHRKFPWFHILMFRRRLYRLIRNRFFKRVKTPWNETRHKFYRWWLKLRKRNLVWKGKRAVRREETLFRKYIFIPLIIHSKSNHDKRKSKKFKLQLKGLQRKHKQTQGSHLRAHFEHKLGFLPVDLNFVPFGYPAQELGKNGFFNISNATTPTLKEEKKTGTFLDIKNSNLNYVYAQHLKKIYFAKIINKKAHKNPEKNIYENIFNTEKILVNGQKECNQHTEIKKNEIIHISSFFQKTKNNYFYKKFSKKHKPNTFTLNTNKTAAWMNKELKTSDFTRSHRFSRQQWESAILHK